MRSHLIYDSHTLMSDTANFGHNMGNDNKIMSPNLQFTPIIIFLQLKMAKIIFECQFYWLSKVVPPKSDGGVEYMLIMFLPFVSKKQLGQIMNPSCWKKDLENKRGRFRFEFWAFLLSHLISNLRHKNWSLGRVGNYSCLPKSCFFLFALGTKLFNFEQNDPNPKSTHLTLS